MKKNTFQGQRGFSLIELLMVVFMLGLVVGSIYSLYSTHQRSAYVQDEVVEVQQNLRIVMESVTRDLRHAGFLISSRREFINPTPTPANELVFPQPIRTASDDSMNTPILPITNDIIAGQPQRRHADSITMNMASTFTVFAKIAVKQVGIGAPFTVKNPESIDNFTVGDFVRIINTTNRDQPTNLSQNPQVRGGQGTVFSVAGLNKAASTMTLAYQAGYNPATTIFQKGDMIARVGAVADPYPNVVTYCLGPTAACGPNVTCPLALGDPTLCLVKITNGTAQVLAAKISGLQFTYLLDDGTETLNPNLLPTPDFGAIRAVRVTVTGQTSKVMSLSHGTVSGETVRVETAVVSLKNRMKPL